MSASAHKIKLLGPTMFRSFRCVWMLEELGLNFEHDLSAIPWSERAKEGHPMGKIPSLVVETHDKPQFVLYESSAINTFLGRLANRTDLVPNSSATSDIFKQARYDQTVSMIMSEMDAQALWIHRKHDSLGHAFGKANEAVLNTAKDQFEKANLALASQLDPYLLGDEFSAADILYVHCLEWAEGIGWKGGAGNWFDSDALSSRLDSYLERCRQRPAYKAAVERQRAEKEAHKRMKAGKKSNL